MFMLSFILNGLTIVVYVSLAGQGYTHETVNTHAVEHVTADGLHMNHTENCGGTLSKKLNAVNGVQHTFLPSYLDEWMWRHKRGKDH